MMLEIRNSIRLGIKQGVGVGKDRPDFDNWRKEYWQHRADEELKKRAKCH
jgi:hypothetical protein